MSLASSLMNGKSDADESPRLQTHEFIFTPCFTTCVSISITRGKTLWISEVKSSSHDSGELVHRIIQKTIDLIAKQFTLTESDIKQCPLTWTLLAAFVSRDMYIRTAKLCPNSYSGETVKLAQTYELTDMLNYMQPRVETFELNAWDASHKIAVKITRAGAHIATTCELVQAKLPMSMKTIDICKVAMLCALKCASGRDVSEDIIGLRHLATYDDSVFAYIAAFTRSQHLGDIEKAVEFKIDQEKLRSYA